MIAPPQHKATTRSNGHMPEVIHGKEPRMIGTHGTVEEGKVVHSCQISGGGHWSGTTATFRNTAVQPACECDGLVRVKKWHARSRGGRTGHWWERTRLLPEAHRRKAQRARIDLLVTSRLGSKQRNMQVLHLLFSFHFFFLLTLLGQQNGSLVSKISLVFIFF